MVDEMNTKEFKYFYQNNTYYELIEHLDPLTITYLDANSIN